MSQSFPTDPVGTLQEAALAAHELFLHYVAAGFTQSQAMQLICALASASTRTEDSQ